MLLFLFFLCFGSDSVPCPDFLLRQLHQIVHEFGDLSCERESSEQFVWYGETETALRRWAIMPSTQADWSQDEVI